jgi:hypothetical protein
MNYDNYKIIEGDNYDLAIQYFKMKQEGKEVIAEYYDEDDGWGEVSSPSFDEYYKHRLLIPKEKQYVPYTYEDDIVGIKVSSKSIKAERLITGKDEDVVTVGGYSVTYQELFDNYTKLDGTPCGKEV